MKGLTRMLRLFGVAAAMALPTFNAHSMDERLVYSPTGQATFKLRFFGQGDGVYLPDQPPSTWDLSGAQKDKVIAAITYWAELITPAPTAPPAIINIGTYDDQNAFGLSEGLFKGSSSITQLQAVLQGHAAPDPEMGAHDVFVMGKLDFDSLNHVPSQLPRSSTHTDLTGVAFHELAHGLGLANSVTELYGSATPHFMPALGAWASHLRDDNGNAAHPGQPIICSQCENPYDLASFDVRKDQGYFAGANVSEVLAGALPGVPVKILSRGPNADVLDTNYMSHTELANSMMSHQSYRNYASFMEAEQALLQDLGYTIDRRNFFGRSVYGSGQHIINTNGYFQRNEQASAYMTGQYNTATLGLGLHVYGSNNTVVQQADLLTTGGGGAGIRVDGSGNIIIVQPHTRVHADGLNGCGIMFTYGKGHQLVLQGDVQAVGDQGIGINFDFGNNQLGNSQEYRGSYIRSTGNQPLALLNELNGALADRVDLTGRVAGKSAAIYMSPNALVGSVNIMNGAQIQGDIRSDYNQRDASGQQRLTRITFGQLADSEGRGTGLADPAFKWTYNDNIRGVNNLALHLQGGHTTLNGQHEVFSAEVAPAATLSGNASYMLASKGTLVNHGIIAPGNSIGRINIYGDFAQSASGTLLMDVNGAGAHDTLAVSGSAKLGGTLTLLPQRGDWYGDAWGLTTNQLIPAGSTDGAFARVTAQLDSPTLTLQSTLLNANSHQIKIGRQPNAYSQYATGSNERAAGAALYQMVPHARDDIKPLYQALDFSAPDGHVVASALTQISPSAYSAMAASTLARERHIADTAFAQQWRHGNAPASTDGWTGFAAPFGSGHWQDGHDRLVGHGTSAYGVVFGALKRSNKNPDWVMGLYAAASRQSTTIDAPLNASGKSSAFNLGLHASYAPDSRAGMYAFGQGQVGVEHAELDRHIRFEGYSAKHSSDWTSWSGLLAAGGGYRWSVTEALSVGHVASLAYAQLSRPGMTESGSDPTALKLSRSHFNSLRSRVGFNGTMDWPLKNGASLKANTEITWNHELLNPDFVQEAHFIGYEQARYSSTNKVLGRDSLGLRAGLSYDIKKNVALGANVSTELFSEGRRSLAGDVSLKWAF